jgi:two-component system response regulator YesN
VEGKDNVILWVDLTEAGGAPISPGVLAPHANIHYIRDPGQIGSAIRAVKPSLICFEYDYPDSNGLTALCQTKRDYAALPIVLITTYHSESLAVWALRARVCGITS